MAHQEWLDLAKIDPEFEAVLKELPPISILAPDIATMRKNIRERKKALTAAQSNSEGVKEEDQKISTRDGASITVRIYQPESPSGGRPLVIFLHGGGFCIGDLDSEEANCRLLVQKHGCVCVNVDYRLAPEHPFPTPVNDCWDATKWAAANASRLGANPSKGFIVGGTSAGGNMAAVIGTLARDEKLSPPLTGLALLIPGLMDYRAIPEKYKAEIQSYEQNKHAPVLGHAAIKFFTSNYQGNINSPLYNLFAPPADFSNLPPIFFQVCGMDPFRDEALLFEQLLRTQYKTKTKLNTYPGVPHSFWSFVPAMEGSKRFVQDTVTGVGWLLEQVSASA